ncbi:MAG: RNA methyltransferase [Bacteroidales bacterium]|nr:RNA methyltransferase [Bacteroidales bacterium]
MHEIITSSRNPKILNLLALQSKSRERKKQQCMIIEGYREINRAVVSGIRIRELYYCKELDQNNNISSLPVNTSNFQTYPVSREIFSKLAYRESSDGLLAVADNKVLQLQDLRLKPNPLIIILESVEKPGNLGAVMRTADAAGVDAVIICDPLTDIYNPNTIRSSVGCVFTRPVIAASSEDVIHWLKQHSIRSFAAALTASAESYSTKDYRGSTAFVMGTEATGLSRQWLESCDSTVIIPMLGVADSLNVSVSTAILVFEAVRQRM